MPKAKLSEEEKRLRHNERVRKYYHAHRDTILERAKEGAKRYYNNNADKIRARVRARHALLVSSHNKMLEIEDLERRTLTLLEHDPDNEEFHDCVETSI